MSQLNRLPLFPALKLVLKKIVLTPSLQPSGTQRATPTAQAAAMTRSHQRSNSMALSEKEHTVQNLADRNNYADILEVIPALSNCTREVLEEFAANGVFKAQADAGKTLFSGAHSDQNLYVLVSGSACLDAGDDVIIDLEPGDYFGRNPARRPHHEIIASVVAERDVDVLVIGPQELQQLQQASSRSRHPSQIDWRAELSAPTPRFARRRDRRVLANVTS